MTDGAEPARARQALLELTARAVEAGVDVIQLRERDLDGGALFALASAMTAIAKGSSTRIVINDRLDVALAAGADGVHLRGDSAPPLAVRAVVPPGFSIGRSVHDEAEAAAVSANVEYLIAGTTWATPSKPTNAPLLGVDGLRAIARAARVPVLAIGGVTIERIPDVARAGAAGIAAVGLFADARLRSAQATSLADLVRTARRLYDEAQHA